MTSMQNEAVALNEKMPEEQLSALIVIMQAMDNKIRESRRLEKARAFEELERLRRPIPDLDERKDLEEWREEKFGGQGTVLCPRCALIWAIVRKRTGDAEPSPVALRPTLSEAGGTAVRP